MQQNTSTPAASTGGKITTKVKLIRAAERLFAENGLGAVSVRDITRAAGARNESALHYHFGSKEALIRAVFADRIKDIDGKRLTLLAALDQEGASGDITRLMEATMAPMFEACLDEGGRLYATFLMQIAADPRFDVDRLMEDLAPDGVREVQQRLRAELPQMPEQTLITRLRRLPAISISLMADHAREVAGGTAPSHEWAIAEAGASLAAYLTGEPGRS